MRRGSVYIFVVFSMFIIFIMLTITIRSTSYRVRIIHTYLQSALEYDLAKGATIRRVAELNQILWHNLSLIHGNILLDVENITERVIFRNGSFYLRDNPHTYLFMEEAARILRIPSNMSASYTFNTPTDSVSVVVSARDISQNQFFLTSEARNSDGVRRVFVQSRIVLSTENTLERIHESYIFRYTPDFLAYHNSPFIMTGYSIANYNIDLRHIEWSKNNSVVHLGNRETVDILEFYNNGFPSILIIDSISSDHRTILYSSNPSISSNFRGVIYTGGILQLNDITFEGIAIARDVVAIESNFIHNNLLLDVPIQDRQLKRAVYDFFNLTRFYAMYDQYEVFYADQIRDMLGWLKLSPIFSIEITEFPVYAIAEMHRFD